MGFTEIVKYDLSSGVILASLSGEERDVYTNAAPFVHGAGDPSTHYVDIDVSPHALKLRKDMHITQNKKVITANGVDVVIFTGVPDGAEGAIGEQHFVVLDGTLEWSTTLPGAYPVKFTLFPYLEWKSLVAAV